MTKPNTREDPGFPHLHPPCSRQQTLGLRPTSKTLLEERKSNMTGVSPIIFYTEKSTGNFKTQQTPQFHLGCRCSCFCFPLVSFLCFFASCFFLFVAGSVLIFSDLLCLLASFFLTAAADFPQLRPPNFHLRRISSYLFMLAKP